MPSNKEIHPMLSRKRSQKESTRISENHLSSSNASYYTYMYKIKPKNFFSISLPTQFIKTNNTNKTTISQKT